MTTHRMMSALGEYVEIVIPDNYEPPPAIHLKWRPERGMGHELFVLVPPSEMDERDTPVPTLTHLLKIDGTSGNDVVEFGRMFDLAKLSFGRHDWEELGEPYEVTVRIMRPIAQRNDPSDPEALPHDPGDEPSSDAR